MGANAYARIAERYQVPALDDEAVERFFLDIAPTLSREEREAILSELRDDELAALPRSGPADLPIDVPTFSIDEAPLIARPNSLTQLIGELSAAVEKRVGDRLDQIEHSLDRIQEQIGERNPDVQRDRARVADLIDGRTLVHAELAENVREVVRRMAQAKVGVVAVLDRGRLAGMFSERDLMERVVAPGLDPDGTSVSSVMRSDIVFADEHDDVATVLKKMRSLSCRQVLVVAGGKLIGAISLRDLLGTDSDIWAMDDVLLEARVASAVSDASCEEEHGSKTALTQQSGEHRTG